MCIILAMIGLSFIGICDGQLSSATSTEPSPITIKLGKDGPTNSSTVINGTVQMSNSSTVINGTVQMSNSSTVINGTVQMSNSSTVINGTEPVHISNPLVPRMDIVAVLDRSMTMYTRRSPPGKKSQGEDQKYDLNHHIQTLMSKAAEAFQDPSLNVTIDLKLRAIIQSTLESHQLVMKVNTEKETYLMIRPPLTSKLSLLDHADAVVIFTRTSLCWTGHCGARGLATTGSICRAHENVAVIKVMGESSAFVFTHELGHFHVGRRDNDKCQSLKKGPVIEEQINKMDDYIKIMQGSSTNYSTKGYELPSHWTWTSCCESALKAFLRSHQGGCLYDPF